LNHYVIVTPRRQQANNFIENRQESKKPRLESKIWIEEAFQAGIKYLPPNFLLRTSGKDWVYQPHQDLYKILATNVLEHYAHYKKNEIDKTYIPIYFYLGGAGTGKSRNASEFASSIQEAITLHPQHPLYHELAQRLKAAFVFHVSFENGTTLAIEERRRPWNAVGARMLHQLLSEPLSVIRHKYKAEPDAVFRLVAKAENIDLYDGFTGILVVDGIQKAFIRQGDGNNKDSSFYGFLGQISGLSLTSLGKAPFIMTCVTATCFGPANEFLANSHQKRVYLPLNRIHAPTWKNDNSPVLNDSPGTCLLVDDVGGHARAIEAIADELAEHQTRVQPNITDLANAVYTKLRDRYKEATSVMRGHIFPIVQCIIFRQKIYLMNLIPRSDLPWEHVTAPGLIWFERAKTNGIEDYDYDTPGYLMAPYFWLWMLARLAFQESPSDEYFYQFLSEGNSTITKSFFALKQVVDPLEVSIGKTSRHSVATFTFCDR
jgi:hypothetical protein